MIRILAPFVWWVRLCQTKRTSLPRLEKLARAVLMLPALAIILLCLRIHLRLRGAATVEVTTLDGARFTCHPPDLIQMYLWLFGVWEPDLTHYIRRQLRSGHLFIDVGANIGYDTVLAARSIERAPLDVDLGNRDGKSCCVAIEASPAVFAHLTQSIALNNLSDHVRLINKAASDVPGDISIYAGPQHNIGLTTTIRQRGFTAEFKVEALPLDDMLSVDEIDRSRLIKIDVEGAEPQVFAGMKKIIEASRNTRASDLEILIELSPLWWSDPTKRPIDVLQPFFDAGFHPYEMENNYWPWRYLWPNVVAPINRCTRDLTRRPKRIDLILSRRDVAQL